MPLEIMWVFSVYFDNLREKRKICLTDLAILTILLKFYGDLKKLTGWNKKKCGHIITYLSFVLIVSLKTKFTCL